MHLQSFMGGCLQPMACFVSECLIGDRDKCWPASLHGNVEARVGKGTLSNQHITSAVHGVSLSVK
ncbi:hypothetical protein H9L39_04059 [Fusarium oxysporum f. sp. albedinis]|nr:hypothetical protein H9L39_04059 [Fusarium oxysporum f. sp. albedinis]